MPALLDCYRCPACDQFHDFFDEDNYAFLAEMTYSFTCPVTGEESMLRGVTSRSNPVSERPAEAVVVRTVARPG